MVRNVVIMAAWVQTQPLLGSWLHMTLRTVGMHRTLLVLSLLLRLRNSLLVGLFVHSHRKV